MTDDTTQHYSLLDDLDTRQNDVLRQLDELNGRIEALLKVYTAPSDTQPSSTRAA